MTRLNSFQPNQNLYWAAAQYKSSTGTYYVQLQSSSTMLLKKYGIKERDKKQCIFEIFGIVATAYQIFKQNMYPVCYIALLK